METEAAPALVCTEAEISERLNNRPVVIKRIGRFLANRYGPHLDMSSLPSGEDSRVDILLTRSLAAHAAAIVALHDPETAAACVVDGGQDLGIDAIAFDFVEKKCWVIQAKFQYSGRGEVGHDSIRSMLDGFDALVSDNFSRANRKILAMESQIRRAATECAWKFILVLATTSADAISQHWLTEIHSRLSYQDPGNSGYFTFLPLMLDRIQSSVESAFDAAKVNLTIQLSNWGCVDDPYLAYYGQVDLVDVLGWKSSGNALFAKNLRGIIKSSQISDSISRTIANSSELFWYFNNGATILCEKIERSGPYRMNESRDSGRFECVGASVVNGAQTIGAIWDHSGDGALLDPRAKLTVRLISLQDAPPDFSQLVTSATNTQQDILAKDFATLDAAQRRIARDFGMDGRTYAYRRGDEPPPSATGCTIEELAGALACAHSVELAIIAYRNPGYLIDPSDRHYKIVFGNDGHPTSEEAWFCVRVARSVIASLERLKARDDVAHKTIQIATHGWHVIQHRVFSDPSVKSLRSRRGSAEADFNEVVLHSASRHLSSLARYIAEHHDREYLQVLFKNTQKVKFIDDRLNEILTKGDRPPVQQDLFAKKVAGISPELSN